MKQLIQDLQGLGFTSQFTSIRSNGDIKIHSEYFLLCDAQRWLRTKRIDVDPYFITSSHNTGEIEVKLEYREYTFYLRDKGISRFIPARNGEGIFDTQEEALKAGISEAIKILKEQG